MKKTKTFIILWFLITAGASAQQSSLALIKKMSQESDLVLLGRVTSVSSRWSQDGKMILSDLTIVPSEVMKGTQKESFILEIAGGTVGAYTQVITHQMQFVQGEEGIFFLVQSKKAPFNYRLNKLGGKFIVENNISTGRRYAFQDFGDVNLTMRNKLTKSFLLDDIRNEVKDRN